MRIAILGRGIGGLSLAFRLIQRGIVPTIFGKAESSFRASSSAQGLICNKGLIWPRQTLFQAKIRSLRWVKDWLRVVETTTGCQINQDFSGVFEPYFSKEDFRRAIKRIYKGNFLGCFRTQNLPPSALPVQFLSNPIGTLFYPGDGWYDPQQILEILESFCQRSGSQIISQHIDQITFENSQPLLLMQGGQRYLFDKVIIAAGTGSQNLLESLDIKTIRFFYHPGQILEIDRTFSQAWSMVRKTYSLIGRQRLYLGATTDKIQTSETKWEPEDPSMLLQIFQNEFMIDAEHEIFKMPRRSLSGVRVRLEDRHPIFGSLEFLNPNRTELKNLYLLTGFYKSGLQLADMMSFFLEKEILDQSIEPWANAFHTSRFQKA